MILAGLRPVGQQGKLHQYSLLVADTQDLHRIQSGRSSFLLTDRLHGIKIEKRGLLPTITHITIWTHTLVLFMPFCIQSIINFHCSLVTFATGKTGSKYEAVSTRSRRQCSTLLGISSICSQKIVWQELSTVSTIFDVRITIVGLFPLHVCRRVSH